MNTVLVATERDIEHNVLTQALDGRGYQIVRSRDGLDTLDAARNQPPQVLLVNVALPKMDGFALYRRFQQDEQLRKIPIVLFSTRSNDQKSERFAQELGAVRFVSNALKPGALNGVLEEALSAKVAAPLPAVPLRVVPTPAKREPPATPAPTTAPEATLKLAALTEASLAAQQLIAEQTQLRDALQAAQQQLDGAHTWQTMFTQSPVAMWVVSKSAQKMLAVNDAALRLFAYTQAEFMQLDSPAMLRDPGQANSTNVFAFRTKDGRALSLLVNTRDLSFKTQAAELWVAHDVSYRVRGERAMAEEVQRVKGILANLPAAYWVINAEAQLCDANLNGSKLLGYSRDQLLEHGMQRLMDDEQQANRLRSLQPGESLQLTLRHQDGSELGVEFTAGNGEFGAGLRLLLLRVVENPNTVELPVAAVSAPKLPAILEMLRYAEDADEATLLQYALAQIAHAFDSPLALFASVERITQTFNIVASQTQTKRRIISNGGIAIPKSWRSLLTPRTVHVGEASDPDLMIEGLPEISRHLACSSLSGRDHWLLVLANREQPYSAIEQREVLDCAEILVTLLGRMRQQVKLQSMATRSASATDSMVTLLERLLDHHDVYAAGSGQRVATLAVALAKQLNVPTERHSALKLAARLHDIGHLMLPQSLLLSPTIIDEGEQALMQTHVQRGVNLLNGVDLSADVASIVEQHHERLDGTGYPAALSGEQITMEARILAVADAMDALCSYRAYRPARAVPLALAELQAEAGRGYDVEVVAACVKLFTASNGQWPV